MHGVDPTGWIGRSREEHDVANAAPVARLMALLDRTGPLEAALPPLAHWLYFLEAAPQSALGVDGHPRRGGFLPPIDLPRRMWAGGEVRFLAPIPIGASLARHTKIADVRLTEGRSGRLAFVTLQHEIFADGIHAISEEQNIVYRGQGAGGGAANPATRASAERKLTLGAVALFRFSALTFNGHRIHYDQAYACEVEGYGGLVVHGPLQATLLMDFALAHDRTLQPRRFCYRAVKPLLADRPFHACVGDRGDDTLALWTRDAEGHATMEAVLGLDVV